MTLKLRAKTQVYSGEVRIGTIYKTHSTPGGNEWFWGPQRRAERAGSLQWLRGHARNAKAEFAASWRAWIKAAGLSEDMPAAA